MSASNVAAKSPVPFGEMVKDSLVPVVMSVAAPSKIKPVDPMLLLVKVSAPAKVAKVPLVGKVTLVAPPEVNVIAPDPAVVKFCPKVKVPVVHVGAPAPPETKACPVVPAELTSIESASE